MMKNSERSKQKQAKKEERNGYLAHSMDDVFFDCIAYVKQCQIHETIEEYQNKQQQRPSTDMTTHAHSRSF